MPARLATTQALSDFAFGLRGHVLTVAITRAPNGIAAARPAPHSVIACDDASAWYATMASTAAPKAYTVARGPLMTGTPFQGSVHVFSRRQLRIASRLASR